MTTTHWRGSSLGTPPMTSRCPLHEAHDDEAEFVTDYGIMPLTPAEHHDALMRASLVRRANEFLEGHDQVPIGSASSSLDPLTTCRLADF